MTHTLKIVGVIFMQILRKRDLELVSGGIKIIDTKITGIKPKKTMDSRQKVAMLVGGLAGCAAGIGLNLVLFCIVMVINPDGIFDRMEYNNELLLAVIGTDVIIGTVMAAATTAVGVVLGKKIYLHNKSKYTKNIEVRNNNLKL